MMSLLAMDMPETHAELIDWLERQLVGPDLGSLVAELSAVQSADPHAESGADGTSAMNLLKGRIPEVIESGLTVLDTEQVRSLLRHPRCLLELQELVLTAGGAHWEKRMEDTAGDEFQQIADTGWRRMQLAIAPPMELPSGNGRVTELADPEPAGRTTNEPPPPVRISEQHARSAASHRYRSASVVVLGTAALFLLGVFGLHQAGWVTFHAPQSPEVAQKWGWERPGAIPTTGSPAAYLNSLAHTADEWFNKRPTERDAVEQRIREFSRGCQVLIESQHVPLAETDAGWLVDKCKAWRNKLDGHLAALEAGEDPLSVRAAADETVEKLMKAMRTRADEIT